MPTPAIIGIAVSLTHNIKKTESEMINKYKELAIQLKDIWIHPIVISAKGDVSKKLAETIGELAISSKLII